MPFSASEFHALFAAYNQAIWPLQVALLFMAILMLAAVAFPSPRAGRLVSAGLALLWAWMAIAYHAVHFTRINPAAWLFAVLFLGAGLRFAQAAWKGELTYSFASPDAAVGVFLVLLALVAYPLAGFALGVRYPANPTFGLPCPTTLFTLGMLHFATPRAHASLVTIPLLWAVFGGSAAFLLGVPQDLLLLVAAAATLVPRLARPRRATRTGGGLVRGD